MTKKFISFMHQKNSVTSASFILIITLFLSNVLGVLRDHYLTQKIPTDMLSVYYAAFNIPDFIFNVLILGAIASAFIPVFTTLITRKKDQEAWMVTTSIINLAIIFLVLISVVIFLLMPAIAPLVVPGFDTAKRELMIKLTRIMLFSPLLFGLSYIFGGILNSFKRFFVYSLAPLVYNLVIILGTLLFGDKFGVVGVASAVVLGAFFHFIIQIPVALKLGFRWQGKIYFHHWGVRRIGLLMLPRSIALGATQIMNLVFTAIASNIGGFSIAALNLANNIQTMPTVVFGTAFATAIFPTLSEAVSKNENETFSYQIEKITRVIIFFMIPLTIMLILLRTEIVRLILGSGFFGWQQTIFTAQTLGYFSISLVFSGLAPLFARSFYALHNTKIPMILTILSVLISITLGKIFSNTLGVSGLALGFSIGTAISTSIYYLMLRKKAQFNNEKKLIIFCLKIILAALLCAVAIQECKEIVGNFVNMQRFWGVLTKTVLALGAGTAVYLLCCWIFGIEEISAIKYVFSRFSVRGANNETDSSR